ncbi:YcgN family cysteine cluster protein [Marinomonas sp. 15G1-11]|uniref:YcgN family cysteine cluster protein n=1 Tax=Marinomonas phaeophyticola TaxID=3004091 RepID=A0ABT4JV52_9GAMM|nr:YcgN family cysteine cluster protein [Marinomonas sp. 15G1-11]MCZ2722277.1 YcgN family cysteine cluster protein [Marinomonas sp. 15G1-11]
MIAKRYEPFWVTTKLEDMSPEEWESVCDGCGKCCLQKIEDIETREIFFTTLSCSQLNTKTCQCKVYDTRQEAVPNCITLTPKSIDEFEWLPDTCSYRVLQSTGTLPNWHPLIVGSQKEMIRQGLTVSKYAENESTVNEDDWDLHVIRWVHGLPQSYQID